MSKRGNDPGYAAGWCIHYRSAHDNQTCEAGVDYKIFREGAFKANFARQPCFLTETGESKTDATSCPHLRRPTPEEIKLHNEWVVGRLARLADVLVAITPWREKHARKQHAEVIDCPACKGRLHLSIYRNGHVHGKCETPDCVGWME